MEDGVVEGRADGTDFVVCGGGIDAIGEKDDEQGVLRVDPERCAGESIVAIGLRREIMAAR